MLQVNDITLDAQKPCV